MVFDELPVALQFLLEMQSRLTNAHSSNLYQSDALLKFIASFKCARIWASCLTYYASLVSLTHMYTQMPKRRKLTEREKHLSQDERLHTHCLHAESLPTPSRDSACCSRGFCYADTLQLASLLHAHQRRNTLASLLLFHSMSLSSSLSLEHWYYSSSQGRDRRISGMTWPLRRISSHESPRHGSLVFPVAGVARWALRRGTSLATRRAWKATLTMMLDNCFPFTHVLGASDKNSMSL